MPAKKGTKRNVAKKDIVETASEKVKKVKAVTEKVKVEKKVAEKVIEKDVIEFTDQLKSNNIISNA